MHSFQDALDLLLEHAPQFASGMVPLENAMGRVLRGMVAADRDFPAFDRVMMDGFALRHEDWRAGIREYRVIGTAAAGAPQGKLADETGTCLEVMTGAPCPEGADCIVPVEEVAGRAADRVTFGQTVEVTAGEYLHRRGADALAGQVLLEAGTVIGAREVGVAASCGYSSLEVSCLPKIGVVATGDELVAVDQVPQMHQIRQSNGWSLLAGLQRAGYPVARCGVLGDESADAVPFFLRLLEECGWIFLTGAVSMGGRDFVPALLDSLGCRKLFHGVAQRPGKPAGCWIGPEGQVILALPGNPVAALTGLHALGLPALAAASGQIPLRPRLVSVLDGSFRLERFTRHLTVKLSEDRVAVPAPTGNSGDFIGLLGSEGFVTIPPHGDSAVAFPFTPWH